MNQKERYNQIWECGDVIKPEKWSVWEIVKNFQEARNLEIGPGNFPKIPIKNGFFLDVSDTAIRNLEESGGYAVVGNAIDLPFKNNFFDLIVAIEVMEHIGNDKKALSEIARVLKPSSFFLFSVPLKPELYDEADHMVGHARRYEIKELIELLTENGFCIIKYRYPSSFLKLIDKGTRFLGIREAIYKNIFKDRRRINLFQSLQFKFIGNFYAKSLAFLDKKGAPKWQADIENLSEYDDKAIVLFCQKV